MVRVPETEAENAIHTLLQSKGWRDPAILNLKFLKEPFQTMIRSCVHVTTAAAIRVGLKSF